MKVKTVVESRTEINAKWASAAASVVAAAADDDGEKSESNYFSERTEWILE